MVFRCCIEKCCNYVGSGVKGVLAFGCQIFRNAFICYVLIQVFIVQIVADRFNLPIVDLIFVAVFILVQFLHEEILCDCITLGCVHDTVLKY